MTDLPTILPDFSPGSYTHLIPSLDRHGITVADLLSLDALEVAKRATLPILDLRRLAQDIVHSLQNDLHISTTVPGHAIRDGLFTSSSKQGSEKRGQSSAEFLKSWHTISILDPILDKVIGGGIPTGYLTEITGESAAGKTQLLLTLLLSAQLPPPLGLSRSSIYISTEAPLSTTRLAQLLETHPRLSQLPVNERPSLTRVLAIPVQDLESQDHILAFQLPNAIRKYNVGLVILDSVAANYRAEHGSAVPRDLANRATQLAKLGKSLRDLAKQENIAVVVANQVSDRFEELNPGVSRHESPRSSSPFVSSSPAPGSIQGGAPPPPSPPPPSSAAAGPSNRNILDSTLSLDFQQRFFTGWGDETTTTTTSSSSEGLKTPALGLAWTNQIACRIALRMEAHRVDAVTNTRTTHNGGGGVDLKGYDGGTIWADGGKRRFFRLVFAPWAEPTSELIEYEIRREGVTAVLADHACDGEDVQM